jgi:hypothetical protein
MSPTIAVVVPLCVLISAASSDEPSGVRHVQYFGYDDAVELTTDDQTVRVVVAGQNGGRILEYSLHGENVLFLSDDEIAWHPGDRAPSSAGRFDIGPELVVPPRDLLWSGTWQVEIVADRHVRLTSPDDPGPGVRLIREFRLDGSSPRLICLQKIVNVSDHPVEWCHWSRTFVVGRGVCAIPVSEPSRFPNKYVLYEDGSMINMRPEDPNVRFRDGWLEVLGPPRKPKLGFDSYSGTIGYFAPNNLLFVKRFRTFPNRVYSEAAGLTISVWYPDHQMVELEPIGPRERLMPGNQASFQEEWFLIRHPFPESKQPDLTELAKVIASMPLAGGPQE